MTNTNKTTINNPKSLKNTFIITLIFLSLVLIFSFMGTVSAVSSSSSGSSVIYVNDTGGNDNNNGTSWQWAKKSIKNATGTVTENWTVYIANGIYTGENNTNITINRNMNIIGQSQKGTIINGTNTSWIFNIVSGIDVNIQNLTIANANATGVGGAITNQGDLKVENCKFTGTTGSSAICNNCNSFAGPASVSSTVENCTFINNAAYNGGAIFNYCTNYYSSDYSFISSTVENCTFINNSATQGGAICNTCNPVEGHSSGSITVKNCNFINNSAIQGGAICNLCLSEVNHGSASISSAVENCTFINNSATGLNSDGYGGAIQSAGTLSVTGSTFTGNTACMAGGAISIGDGVLNVTGSTFTGNVAEYGGAIYNWYSPIEVHFNRFYDNDATGVNTGNAIRTDYTTTSTADVRYNWWGYNNPDFNSLISGNADHTPWLYMTLTANIGKTRLITASFNNLFDGTTRTDLDPATGHIPDGTSVNFNTDLGSLDCKTVEKQTSNGIAAATLFADEITGIAHLNATLDNQTLYVNMTITPKSSLYLTVTPSKANPVVGDTVVYTLKVGNNGPDPAKDVVMTYVIPEGLEFAGAKVDVGEWNYDAATRTITWNISDVPVGDPYMWLSLRVAQSGHYLINPVLVTSTYDPTLNSDTQSITVNAAAKTTVNAASKTIPLQETGLPLTGLVLAVLAVFGGLVTSKKF